MAVRPAEAARRAQPRFAEAQQVAKDGSRLGTQHRFNNDTTPRYDKAAADLAWKRTMELFKQNLRG